MSHSRVKPSGWALKEKLTYLAINQLDSNVRDSLDKTVAGDSIAGTILIEDSAAIDFQSNSTLHHEAGSFITCEGDRTLATGSGEHYQSGSVVDGYTTVNLGLLTGSHLRAQTGAIIELNGGSTLIGRSSSVISLSSGSTANLAGTVNLTGGLNVNSAATVTLGACTVLAGTGAVIDLSTSSNLNLQGGTITLQSGTFAINNGVSASSAANFGFSNGITISSGALYVDTSATINLTSSASMTQSGTLNQLGPHVLSGSSATTQYRVGVTSASADQTYDVSNDIYLVPLITGNRTYVLDSAGADDGMVLKFASNKIQTHDVLFQCDDLINNLGNASTGQWFFEFTYYSGSWHTTAWGADDLAHLTIYNT